ncbi:hypothetical protein AYI69_g4369 [Smittium culicis]|uniref:Lipoprotein n=1 Tax=Smittium culicis TaxID=133412 RepID=A0A1R1YE89_9FUNG|nr:hypothetical protein AYI69_g4369 [Smittium culicis]
MLKKSAILIFLSACLNIGHSQSPGNFELNFSTNENFSEGFKESRILGGCVNFGSIYNVMRVKTLEDAEMLVYRGFGCKDLIGRKDVCGVHTDKNVINSYGVAFITSIKVEPKKFGCLYLRKKYNID